MAMIGIGLATVWLHGADPRNWRSEGSTHTEDERRFRPSLAQTASGELISDRADERSLLPQVPSG